MTFEQTELGDALDQLADLRDRLDRALVASESARAAAACAVRELLDVGANDAAARVQAMIGAAMGGAK